MVEGESSLTSVGFGSAQPTVLASFLIADQIQSLTSVELEFAVAGDQRHLVGYGVCDDDVVARVAMILISVDFKFGVCLHLFFLQR